MYNCVGKKKNRKVKFCKIVQVVLCWNFQVTVWHIKFPITLQLHVVVILVMQHSDCGSATKLIRPSLAKKWAMLDHFTLLKCFSKKKLYPTKVKSYANFHNKKVNMLIYCLYTIKMFMLWLRKTINKLELATKSSEDFYSHQLMKFHG